MYVKLPPLSHCPLSGVENDQARWSIFTKILLTSSPLAFVDYESSIRLVRRLSVLFCPLATICAVFHLWHAVMTYFLRCQRHLAFSISDLNSKTITTEFSLSQVRKSKYEINKNDREKKTEKTNIATSVLHSRGNAFSSCMFYCTA